MMTRAHTHTRTAAVPAARRCSRPSRLRSPIDDPRGRPPCIFAEPGARSPFATSAAAPRCTHAGQSARRPALGRAPPAPVPNCAPDGTSGCGSAAAARPVRSASRSGLHSWDGGAMDAGDGATVGFGEACNTLNAAVQMQQVAPNGLPPDRWGEGTAYARVLGVAMPPPVPAGQSGHSGGASGHTPIERAAQIRPAMHDALDEACADACVSPVEYAPLARTTQAEQQPQRQPILTAPAAPAALLRPLPSSLPLQQPAQPGNLQPTSGVRFNAVTGPARHWSGESGSIWPSMMVPSVGYGVLDGITVLFPAPLASAASTADGGPGTELSGALGALVRRPSCYGCEANDGAAASSSSAAVSTGSSSSAASACRLARPRALAPLVQLTTGLRHTYARIRDGYGSALLRPPAPPATSRHLVGDAGGGDAADAPRAERTRPDQWDDANGDYIVQAGEIWGNRYQVLNIIGKGSFGQVVRALDGVTKSYVAIKIIKNKRAFTKQAAIEIGLLQRMNRLDADDSRCVGRPCSAGSARRGVAWRVATLSDALPRQFDCWTTSSTARTSALCSRCSPTIYTIYYGIRSFAASR